MTPTLQTSTNQAFIRSQFNTAAGLAAFDQLAAFGGQWSYMAKEGRPGGSLSAPLEIRSKYFPQKTEWSYKHGTRGASFDEVAIKMLEDVKARTADQEGIVVVSVSKHDVAAFSYDKQSDTFQKLPERVAEATRRPFRY